MDGRMAGRTPSDQAGSGGAVTGAGDMGDVGESGGVHGRGTTGALEVRALMRRIGAESRSGGSVYLVGGSSAVLLGWRETTIDVDLKLDPKPLGALDAIARAKEALKINVELSAPDDFVPPVPGWRTRSRFLSREGLVDFFHYDFYGQALAKIERGHAQDLRDVRAMHALDLIAPARLASFFDKIEPELVRYPAVAAQCFRTKLEGAVAAMTSGQDGGRGR